MHPVSCLYAICDFDTRVQSAIDNKGCSSLITTLSEVEDYHVALTNLSWMISSKVICPWIPEFTSDNLEYYELKESEVEEDKEWLRLYADLALYTKFHYFPRSPVWGGPFELRKIIVQTREDVESKKKVKGENAIFYISFDPNQWRSSLQCYHKENNGWNVL